MSLSLLDFFPHSFIFVANSCLTCHTVLGFSLTLTNRLQRCEADTDRCTAADGESPPEKQTAFICTSNSKEYKTY